MKNPIPLSYLCRYEIIDYMIVQCVKRLKVKMAKYPPLIIRQVIGLLISWEVINYGFFGIIARPPCSSHGLKHKCAGILARQLYMEDELVIMQHLSIIKDIGEQKDIFDEYEFQRCNALRENFLSK
jgi:hypothetical protein